MNRQERGLTNYLNGISAKECVEREYCEAGAKVLERRWRGKAGEVDLIFLIGSLYVFVEVKKARDFSTAATRLTAGQMQRIARAAEEFSTTQPLGLNCSIRIDVALVNDASECRIIENVTL